MATKSTQSLEARLLKRRDYYLAQAAEIDRAVATIRATLTESARNGFPAKLRKAVAAQKGSRPTPSTPDAPPDINKRTQAAIEYRRTLIRELLSDGQPRTKHEIVTHLEGKGITNGLTNISDMMRHMPGVRIKGRTSGARWSRRAPR